MHSHETSNSLYCPDVFVFCKDYFSSRKHANGVALSACFVRVHLFYTKRSPRTHPLPTPNPAQQHCPTRRYTPRMATNRTTTTKRQPSRRSADDAHEKRGTPGVDFSGVNPETGQYTVVRGNYVGEHDRLKAKNLKKNNRQTFKKGEVNPKAPKTPADRKRTKMKICGARRTGKSASGEGICCNPAGWGTSHKGYGHCRHHGGITESHEKAVKTQRLTDMMTTYGEPILDLDPHQALLEEVQRTAGHVKWLRTFIAEFEDKKQLTQFTEMGVEPSVWINLYHKERDRLVAASKAAITAGVAERQVRVAEIQGQMFAAAIQAIFSDTRLGITNAQKAIMPSVVRDHMMELDAGPLEIPEAEVVG